MGSRYEVIAGYVTVETAVPGGRAQVDVPRGADLPGDVPADQVETLLARGAVVEHRAASGPRRGAVQETPDSNAVPDGPIPAVAEWVGSDPDRAQQALDAELARPTPRSTLVATLRSLLSVPPAE